MSDDFEGSKIISLLNAGLDKGQSLLKYVEKQYKEAEAKMEDKPKEAIKDCRTVLDALGKRFSSDTSDLDIPKYTLGKFHLLLASIYLNEDRNLKLAKTHFLHSKNEFASRKWLQLEALAYLGLAITCRKLKELDEARIACEIAENSVKQEAIPNSVAKAALETLNEAIERENEEIIGLILQKPIEEKELVPEEEKTLRLYSISSGVDVITSAGTTDINIVTQKDYGQNSSKHPDEITIDLTECQSVENATYILEIDTDASDGIEHGDWLLIRAKNNPKALNGKSVVVLAWDGGMNHARLKTFVYADDHYFLRAKSRGAESYIMPRYNPGDILQKTSFNSIRDYYRGYGPVVEKHFFEVKVSGEVIERIPSKSINKVTKPLIWQIPIVSDIAAGLGVIAKEDIEAYRYLNEDERNDADFGVRVIGDSMKDYGILPEDIALIQQKKLLPDGEFGAVVIISPKPEQEPLGVLKRYYLRYENNDDLRHLLLKSGNPASEDIVVMEKSVDAKAIWRLCEGQRKSGKISNLIEYYRNAEIDIVGKCVGLLRKDDEGDTKIYHNIMGRFQLYE